MFKPGESGNPAGRPKGAANKSTVTAKKAIADFINGTSGQVIVLWQEVAEQDPEAAVKLWTNLAEYVIPKQSRVAHVGEEGAEPIQIIVDPKI
jgi:hypothetical protein